VSACVCDQRFCPCLFVCLLLFVVVVCVHDQYLTLLCVCLFVSLIMFLFVVVYLFVSVITVSSDVSR